MGTDGEEEDFEKAAMECREELGFTNTSTGELRSFISYAMYVLPGRTLATQWVRGSCVCVTLSLPLT